MGATMHQPTVFAQWIEHMMPKVDAKEVVQRQVQPLYRRKHSVRLQPLYRRKHRVRIQRKRQHYKLLGFLQVVNQKINE